VVEAAERQDLTYCHKKKSHGVRSGDLGGQQCITWSVAVGMGGNGIISLTSAVSQRADT
jgi:hypothetical protein